MAEHNLQSIAFPTLDEAQITRLSDCTAAVARSFADGQTLFAVGDRDMKFFVVKAGEIDIIDCSGDEPKRLTVHRRGEFTGDVSHLTGALAIVSAVARGRCEVLEVSGDALRRALNQCPDLSDIILQAFIARRQLLSQSPEFTGLRVIGSRYSADTFRVRDFLAKNRALFTWVDVETDPQVDLVLKQFGVTEADTPVVACGHLLMLRNPSNRQLADTLGIRQPLEQTVYDLAIVGAGPAGLAAAVYGASEGLNTVVLEQTAPGGQAGSSMRIENYLGFPTGITGSELAGKGVIQANKFGAQLSVSTPVTRLAFEKAYSVLHLDGGETVAAKCLLIASGAEYRRLGVEGCERYEGTGVYYAATPNERISAEERSSGARRRWQFRWPGRRLPCCSCPQGAAAHSRRRPVQEHVQLPGPADRADRQHRAALQLDDPADARRRPPDRRRDRQQQDGRGADGRDSGGVQLHRRSAEDRLATPGDRVGLQGVCPDPDRPLAKSPYWQAPGGSRQPFLLETSRPGVFAAGDVRAGSVKRVASAVGEGSMAVQFVHEYLKEM